MIYKKKLLVDKDLLNQLEQLCKYPNEDMLRDQAVFDKEVIFDNGMRFAIQVISSIIPKEESCWTQGVLFCEEGSELGCTTVGESFEGEYRIDYLGDSYIVEVIEG
jgi:hypothetical protein